MARYDRQAGFGDYGWLLPVLGTAIGLAFGPAVITAVERSHTARATVGSALMDSLRELGGVAGVAALGAVLTARTQNALFDRAVLGGLPQSAAHTLARSALAHGPAAGLGTVNHSISVRTRAWVADSFIDGLHLCLLRGAATVGCAALVVTLLLHGRHAAASSSLLRKPSSAPEAPCPVRKAGSTDSVTGRVPSRFLVSRRPGWPKAVGTAVMSHPPVRAPNARCTATLVRSSGSGHR